MSDLPVVEIADVHLAGVEVDALDLGAHPQVDAVLAVLLRRAGDQLVGTVLEVTGNPVRDAARAVRRESAAVEREDRQVVGVTSALACLRGGGHARRVRTNNEQPLRHELEPRLGRRQAALHDR